ncbi:MAG: class I SAM-dependent methyltransferase [Deltaproteobacteria bacterium]|nr:class I SAM-dependent methyltransferase [Deltaproteobacteria bacterium]
MTTNEQTKKWFGDWANEYDSTLGKVRRHHKLLDLVVARSKVRKNDQVLDIGCGTGLMTLKFLRKADCQVTGVDNSDAMLAIFKKKITELGLQDKTACKAGDAADLEFEEDTFDICASTVTLHHLKNKLPALKKIHSILKPGGRLVIGDIDVDTTGRLTDPKRMLRILDFLRQEYALALKEGGIPAFSRMYDNGKKHILNDGEYCISFPQWEDLCRKARFKNIATRPLPGFEWFKVLDAVK